MTIVQVRALGSVSETEYDSMSSEAQSEFDTKRAELKQLKKEAIETRRKESLEYMKRVLVSVLFLDTVHPQRDGTEMFRERKPE